MTTPLITRLEETAEGSRFRVHPGQTSARAKTTFWVRDRRDPNWPEGPYPTREAATEALCAAILRANHKDKP